MGDEARIPKRITISLSKPVAEALRELAEREFRGPREQAGYILEQALLGEGGQDVCVGPSEVSEEG